MLNKETLYLRGFGLLKIPLLLAVSPSVVKLTSDESELLIRLGMMTKNHLGSMYFGALCIGAEAAAGILAMRSIDRERLPLNFLFKDFRARFEKRAEGHVTFTCKNGPQIQALLARAMASGERENVTVRVDAYVKSLVKNPQGGEGQTIETAVPVADFDITMSVKKRG